ncbi:MAG: hypothetical protein LC117_09090 [Bacteroidia bacterium]|nr:hypothetical protein [Bacteroidia bacterium]MCZ2278067.1 hypothetical protein [Bacteroidia bacterium]
MKNTIKSKLIGSLIAGSLTVFSMSAFAQETKTLKGEILDLSCYMSHGATGQGHKACAQGCLDKGLPAGILNKADGQVYLLVEDHKLSDAYKSALKYAAQEIEITGKIIKKNGVQSILVEKVKAEG